MLYIRCFDLPRLMPGFKDLRTLSIERQVGVGVRDYQWFTH